MDASHSAQTYQRTAFASCNVRLLGFGENDIGGGGGVARVASAQRGRRTHVVAYGGVHLTSSLEMPRPEAEKSNSDR